MHHIGPRGAQRGHHSKYRSCPETCQRRERHHHGIDSDGIQTRQIRRRDDQQFMDARPSQGESQDRSHCREQQSFRQHLTDQAPPAAAQCSPHGQFALTQRRPHQQQIGDVRAGDQQEENYRAHQRQNGRTNLRHQMLLHGNQPDVPIRGSQNAVQALLVK
jgi:hypothetical protein